MAKFKLTNKAVRDLSNIWNYTVEAWSERQAEIYYEMLISTCYEIAKNPDLGKKYDEVDQNLQGLKANHHIIFYQTINEDSVLIIRILHERMDLKSRISE